jgi:hypothetical protein
MTNTIFDLVEADLPEGKKGYLEFAKRAPTPKGNSFLNDIADYGKTALKGTIEGISKLGRVLGPTGNFTSQGTDDALGKQTQALDEIFPTDEGFVQKGLRRGLKEAPTMLSFPGGGTPSTAIRSGAAGYLGQGAEELGLPEWAQAAAEITAFVGPDITKKLLESGKNTDLIKEARKLGISDEALTPLLQSEFKQKWLSKLTPRRGSTEKALKQSKKELDEAASLIDSKASKIDKLNDESAFKLIDKIDSTFEKMPASVREKISKDYRDLYSKDISADSLINFWRDINHEVGPNSMQLSLLKKPVKEALEEIAPELAKDFNLINQLYTKFYPISSRLKPNLMTDLIGASEVIGALASVSMGNYPFLIKIAGEKTTRKLAQQMLINPRFQQIPEKMLNALKENKLPLASKLVSLLQNETKKYSPDIAEKLQEVTEEDLQEMAKLLRNKEK